MATLAEQWIEEEMVQEAREMVLEAISSRFEKAPDDIIPEISALDNRAVLRRLHRQAIICPDLTGFIKAFDDLREA